MKKRYLGLLIIIGIGFGVTTFINKKTYLSEDNVIGVYINNELSTAIPSKDSALFQKAVCDDENVSVSWDNDSWGLLLKNLTKKVIYIFIKEIQYLILTILALNKPLQLQFLELIS